MNVDYRKDAERIYNACKGAGTKEADIIQVIGNRNLAQRHQIRLAYFAKYNKDLLDELDSELSGDFGYLCRILFLGPLQVLAAEIYKVMKKTGSAGGNLNDLICCLSPTEIVHLKQAYLEVLAHENVKDKSLTLEKHIEKETKGPHRDFLLKFISTRRREFSNDELESAASTGRWEMLIDMEEVERNAEVIKQADGSKGGKGHEADVTRILCTMNILELRALYDHFYDVYNISLVDFITKNFKNPLRNAYNTVIMTAVDLRMLLVAQLYNTMHGLGTDETGLSRIICIRSEVDLQNLKMLFQQKVGRPLGDMVKGDTSGDYRSLLLTLLGDK